MKKIGLGMAAIAFAIAAMPASAATYFYSFSSATFSGSGTFTTSNTANANGSFTITNTAGSGTYNGAAYTFSGPNTYAGADNQLFANRPAQYFSFDGTSFALTTALSANLYFSVGYKAILTSGPVISLDSFTLSTTSPGVPEPGTWGLMILGMGAVGGALRRRQKIAVRYAI